VNILELFAGSRSFSKVAESYNHNTFCSDRDNFDNIDYVCDIFDFDINKLPFKPDIIWASPPCTFFSVASIGKHWNKDNTPKTEQAILGIKIVEKMLEIIEQLKPKYFIIENPRGKLRKLNLIDQSLLNTVWYCQYGDERAKPTDIWTNCKEWIPKPVCHNNNKNCHHAPAPRGSQTGTQGRIGSYNRSKVPEQLCDEIIKACK